MVHISTQIQKHHTTNTFNIFLDGHATKSKTVRQLVVKLKKLRDDRTNKPRQSPKPTKKQFRKSTPDEAKELIAKYNLSSTKSIVPGTSGEPFQCPECSTIYNQKRYLVDHWRHIHLISHCSRCKRFVTREGHPCVKCNKCKHTVDPNQHKCTEE